MPALLATLQAACEAAGLAWRGAFNPDPADAVPNLPQGGAAGTLVLLGFAGSGQWRAFAASAERSDGRPDPLDRWSRRVVGTIVERAAPDALALFPFDGPPWLPFQRWAMRAEAVHVSPLGVLIHPSWGLWHAYRGAIALRDRLPVTAPERRPSPCASCAARPCVAACPPQAVSTAGFDAFACVGHVAGEHGPACRDGCLSRARCPIGREHRYGGEQARFHMRALVDSARHRAASAGGGRPASSGSGTGNLP